MNINLTAYRSSTIQQLHYFGNPSVLCEYHHVDCLRECFDSKEKLGAAISTQCRIILLARLLAETKFPEKCNSCWVTKHEVRTPAIVFTVGLLCRGSRP
jgi:hypothetical protein